MVMEFTMNFITPSWHHHKGILQKIMRDFATMKAMPLSTVLHGQLLGKMKFMKEVIFLLLIME